MGATARRQNNASAKVDGGGDDHRAGYLVRAGAPEQGAAERLASCPGAGRRGSRGKISPPTAT